MLPRSDKDSEQATQRSCGCCWTRTFCLWLWLKKLVSSGNAFISRQLADTLASCRIITPYTGSLITYDPLSQVTVQKIRNYIQELALHPPPPFWEVSDSFGSGPLALRSAWRFQQIPSITCRIRRIFCTFGNQNHPRNGPFGPSLSLEEALLSDPGVLFCRKSSWRTWTGGTWPGTHVSCLSDHYLIRCISHKSLL